MPVPGRSADQPQGKQCQDGRVPKAGLHRRRRSSASATDPAHLERRAEPASGEQGQHQDRSRHPGFPQRQSARAMSETAGRVADATGNWVDRLAPPALRPYLRLARFDRPIGAWLLLMPCWWSAGLAATVAKAAIPSPSHMLLFFIGAFVMRGCGCTWNDIVDRRIDAQVARTRSRPIPSGQVSLTGAVVFLMLQALVGLAVLLQFNGFAIGTGVASLATVAVYPF